MSDCWKFLSETKCAWTLQLLRLRLRIRCLCVVQTSLVSRPRTFSWFWNRPEGFCDFNCFEKCSQVKHSFCLYHGCLKKNNWFVWSYKLVVFTKKYSKMVAVKTTYLSFKPSFHPRNRKMLPNIYYTLK